MLSDFYWLLWRCESSICTRGQTDTKEYYQKVSIKFMMSLVQGSVLCRGHRIGSCITTTLQSIFFYLIHNFLTNHEQNLVTASLWLCSLLNKCIYDFCVFPKLKKLLKEPLFQNQEDIINETVKFISISK